MQKYTDEDIRNTNKITCKIASDYLGISSMAVSIGMRNNLLPIIQEYPPLRIKPNSDCHDRLIVLDYGLPTEQAYQNEGEYCGLCSGKMGAKRYNMNRAHKED